VKFLPKALYYRNYRLFFSGQAISLTGTWMQTIGISWLVYSITNSAFLLGVVAFTAQIPIFLVTPFGGVLADRLNRRRLLILTQTLAMLQAFILAGLTLAGIVAVWHIVILSATLGLINAFDIPIRQAFVVDIVEEKADLGNAIAMNSFVFNGARLVGPSIAGIIISILGEGVCFLVNAISFLAVIFALLAMRIRPSTVQKKHNHVIEGLKEGLVYTVGFKPMKYILLLTVLTSIMGMAYVVMLPIFARDILGGGAHTLGFLMGAAGLGALGGAVYLSFRKGVLGLEKIITAATIIFGLGVIAFSFSRHLWLSLLLILCAGFGIMVQTVANNTVLQSLTDDDKRGRVMSFYAMAFMGMMPFGSLLAGFLASKIGAPNALLISGVSCILGGCLFSIKVPAIKRCITAHTIVIKLG
jgi:MFS family permease